MSEQTPPPLELPHQVAADMYKTLGELLGQRPRPAWTPPPPGSTRAQLPAHILAKLTPRIYLSTACEMGQACERAVIRHPDDAEELTFWARWLHDEMCRLNNKYSGVLCSCPCGHGGGRVR